MEQIKVVWTGLRPLLMHSSEMVDELNDLVVRKKELTDKKKKKTEADFEEIRWLDWRGSLYWDEEIGLYIPSDNVEKCIQEGAAKSRLGKQAQASCFVSETFVPLQTAFKAKSPEELYKIERFRFRKAVRIPPRTGARMMTLRPMMPVGWKLFFTLEYEERLINRKDLLKAMLSAGTLIGLCDWRPKFGRFDVEELS